MLRNLIISLLALLLTSPLLAQNLYQYFDGADTLPSQSVFIHIDTTGFDSTRTNSWQIGPPQKTLFNAPATAPNVLITDTADFYLPNDTSRFFFEAHLDSFFWGGSILAVQWYQKLDMDTLADVGIIEFSVDSGLTWSNTFDNPNVYLYYGYDSSNVASLPGGGYAFSGTDTFWRDIWLCFDAWWLESQGKYIQFRVTFASDSVDNLKEGWMIDNLLVHLTTVHVAKEETQDAYMVISPNPTSGRVKISTLRSTDYHVIEHIELIDINGKVVQEWGKSPTRYFIEIGHHPPGVYVLKVRTNRQTEQFQLLLQP